MRSNSAFLPIFCILAGLPLGSRAIAADPALPRVSCWLETSLNRVFPNSPPGGNQTLELATARNRRLSFQACLKNLGTGMVRVKATAEAPVDWPVLIRRVGYVPLQGLNTDTPLTELDGIGQVPGLVPDPLYPEDFAHVGPQANTAFWVTLRIPADAPTGDHQVNILLTVEDEFRFPAWQGIQPETAELTVRVRVHPVTLSKRQDFPVTHWISAESIWDYYRIEPYSERFWELADAYVADLIDHNLNVVYVPIFCNRHERLNRPAQLLRVSRTAADKYQFEFADVRRWIRMASRHGAEYFEFTHFFTPAPTSGKHPQRIFHRTEKTGEMLWPMDISATSATYRAFLEQFLPAFREFLEEEGVLDRCLFHCADEPDGDEQMGDYRRARALLKELAPWMKVMDAMSDPRFAKERLSDMPIPSIATAHLFAEAGCPAWTYFCCGPRGSYLQRLLDTPLPKIRMSGWLFYKIQARGFLHWGHNYWFRFCTSEIADPFQDPAVGAWPGLPYGDPFVVYPGKDGPIDSIRWEVFAESLEDYALLQTVGVKPNDPLLSPLKSYADFPKTEDWINSAMVDVLKRERSE